MTLYNAIGQGYSKTRLSDPRISKKLCDLLDLPIGATVLDVGAGTGKYSHALADLGYSVLALEPSEVMRSQSQQHERVRFLPGSAEKIPLSDNAADGTIVVLALHHFTDRVAAFREIFRVTGNGPIVFLTFDPLLFRKFWLIEYFPMIGTRFRSSAGELARVAEEIQSLTNRNVRTIPFPLPPDLLDRFGAASWANPEAYLDSEIRNGISDFALMPTEEVERCLERLESDLASGRWDEKYGNLRSDPEYDAGYRFIVVAKPPSV